MARMFVSTMQDSRKGAEFSGKETSKTHDYVLFGDQTRPYRCKATGAKPIDAAALQYTTGAHKLWR